MKKTLLIAGILGTFAAAAHAQSSVTLYGTLDAGLVYTNNSGGHNNWQQGSGSVSDTYFGLKGSEDLGGGLQAIFTLENGFNLNNGQLSSANRIFNRLAYVGVSSRDFGSLTLGRQTDGMVDFVGPLSLTGTQYGGTHFAHPFDVDNLNDSFQINNSVKYQSPNFAGFRIGALYGFSNQAGGFANNRAYSVGMSYMWGPLNFGAGYLHLNNSAGTPAQLNTGGAVTDTLGTSLSGALTPTAVPLGATTSAMPAPSRPITSI